MSTATPTPMRAMKTLLFPLTGMRFTLLPEPQRLRHWYYLDEEMEERRFSVVLDGRLPGENRRAHRARLRAARQALNHPHPTHHR